MDPELRRYIHGSILDRAAIRHIESKLPDGAELDRWLEQTAADYEGTEFVCLVVAALAAGREINGRHLIKGAAALTAGDMLPETAMKMTGDVPGYLMQSLRDSFMGHRGQVFTLGVAAVMYKDRGEELPPAIDTMARTIANYDNLDQAALPELLGLAVLLYDDELKSLLRRKYHSKDTEALWRARCDAARNFGDYIRKQGVKPVIEIIPEKGDRQIALGTTMRRSVPRIGRNEPCHCGSGKKYKHCCFEADRERLRQSSDIQGVTREESQQKSDEYLTADRLKRMTVTEVCGLDPNLIPYELYDQYFDRLTEWKEFDRAAEALEKITYWAVDEETWETLIFRSAFFGRKEAVARLLEIRRNAMAECNVPDMRLDTTYQLLPIEDDPVKTWEWIDRQALSILESGDVDDLRLFSLAFLLTKHRALGILLCRGLIPLLSPEEFSSIVDYVLLARGQLSLETKDPISEIVARLSAASDEALETDNALREAKELLALKTREAREAKEARDHALRDVKRHELELARKSEAETAKARGPEESDTLRELRRKAQKYEQELRDKNAEIKTLERRVEEREIEVETIRGRAETDARQAESDAEAAAEEELLLPADFNTNVHQPVRLIEFPRNFEQRLNTFPQNIARAAMLALGRLSAGETKAFGSAVRLKACPSVTRIRLGIDHRLLFRLLPDKIQVIDLIPRQDLERKVKILATMYD